jgi:hypothetical protein
LKSLENRGGRSMSKKIFAWVLLIALLLPMALGACKAKTEVPPEPTEKPMVEPTEVPKEEPTKAPEPTEEPAVPAIDPSGQTVVFWHVWYGSLGG